MADHVKPTPEEIDAQLKATLEQVEKEEKEETPPSEPAEETTEEQEETPDEKETEETEESPEEKGEEEKPKLPDVEVRLKESNREAQRLYKNNTEMNKAIEEANLLPDPTEEELVAEYPEWEDMSATEKKLATKTLVNDRFRQHINKASLRQREIDKWEERVGKFVEDPKTLADNPELEGKGDAFKEYALKDKKIAGSDFDLLVAAFLHDYAKTKPAPKKGKMFETGTGGETKKLAPKSDKLSPEESEKLMKSDYNKWKQYLKEGKLAEVTA